MMYRGTHSGLIMLSNSKAKSMPDKHQLKCIPAVIMNYLTVFCDHQYYSFQDNFTDFSHFLAK